jgi:hypothetical protein
MKTILINFYMVITLRSALLHYLKVHLIVTAAEDRRLTCLEEIRIQTGKMRLDILNLFHE